MVLGRAETLNPSFENIARQCHRRGVVVRGSGTRCRWLALSEYHIQLQPARGSPGGSRSHLPLCLRLKRSIVCVCRGVQFGVKNSRQKRKRPCIQTPWSSQKPLMDRAGWCWWGVCLGVSPLVAPPVLQDRRLAKPSALFVVCPEQEHQ